MKIINGKYKGYKIKTLQGIKTRPTSARVKEDIFNILNNYFIYKDKIGLDIFAGSGQLGIEGLSRGLQWCYLNDYNPSAYKIIITNIKNLKIINSKVLNCDYRILLNLFIKNNKTFDILFLDPPFKKIKYYYDIITLILKNNIINNYGIIVCESNQELLFIEFKLVLLRYKKYKKKYLYILRLEKGEN